MYCENCGKEIEAGKRLCAECQPATPKKEKKSKKLLLAVIGGILVVAIVAVVLFWGSLSLFFRRSFSDPADYLQEAESAAMQDTAATLSRHYGQAQKVLSAENQLTQLELGIDLNDMLAGLTEGVTHGDGKLSVAAGESCTQLSLKLQLGEETVEAQLTLDKENNKIYLSLPQLQAQPVAADLGDLNLDSLFTDPSRKLPTQKQVKALLESFIPVVTRHYKQVTAQETTVTCGEMSQELYALTVTFSHRELAALEADLLKLLQADEQNVLSAFGDTTALQEEITRSLEELEGVTSTDTALTMTVYLDREDRIVGRTLESGETTLGWLTLTDGNRYASRYTLDSLVLEGDGKEKNGKKDGSFTISVEDTPYLHLNIFGVEDGRGTAQFSLAPELASTGDQTALLLSTLVFEVQWVDGRLTLGAEAMGMPIVQAYGELSITEGQRVTPPENAVEVTDTAAISAWIEEADWDGFVAALENCGLPTDWLDDLWSLY